MLCLCEMFNVMSADVMINHQSTFVILVIGKRRFSPKFYSKLLIFRQKHNFQDLLQRFVSFIRFHQTNSVVERWGVLVTVGETGVFKKAFLTALHAAVVPTLGSCGLREACLAFIVNV